MNNIRFLYSALAVSFVLNGFLVGFIFGHNGSGWDHPFPPPGGPMGPMMGNIHLLPPDQQADIRIIIQKNMGEGHTAISEMGALFSKIRDVLTAPKFSEEALKSITYQIDEKDMELKHHMVSMLAEIAKKLPDDDRVRFFSSMPLPGNGPPPRF